MAASEPPWEPSDESILLRGTSGGLAYATQIDEECLARKYYEALKPADQQKFDHLFFTMTEHGKITNPQKFRRDVGHTVCLLEGKPLKMTIAEFKIHGRRILAYQRGSWWLLLTGFDKGVTLRVEVERAGWLACEHLTTTSKKESP